MQQERLLVTKDEPAELPPFKVVLAPFWESRVAILLITLLIMACGLGWAFLASKYQSHGFFQFGGPIPIPKPIEKQDKTKTPEKEPSLGIMLADYKRYVAAFSTHERFDEYVKAQKLEDTPGLEELSRSIARGNMSSLIEPIYPFTKLDAKELIEQPKENSNNVIGLRIKYEGETPEIAQRIVGLLGRYAMDSIIYLIYSDALRYKQEEMNIGLIRLENEIITHNTLLEGYRRRIDELKGIIVRNPSLEAAAGRQVVTVTEENARYLPPATQLATTEIEAAQANEDIIKARRERQQNLLFLEYYDRAKELLDSTKSGETVLHGLESVKKEVFKDKDMHDNVIKEVYNKISVDNRNAMNIYLQRSRFIAGPTLAQRSTTRLGITLALSAVAGLFLAVVFVIARKSWLRG